MQKSLVFNSLNPPPYTLDEGFKDIISRHSSVSDHVTVQATDYVNESVKRLVSVLTGEMSRQVLMDKP